MSNVKIFAVTFCTTTCVVLLLIYTHRAAPPPDLRWIGDSFFISSQLKPENLDYLRRQHIDAIIDLRSDGEASRPDGPAATEILSSAQGAGFSADDLRDNINQRIAFRTPLAETKR